MLLQEKTGMKPLNVKALRPLYDAAKMALLELDDLRDARLSDCVSHEVATRFIRTVNALEAAVSVAEEGS